MLATTSRPPAMPVTWVPWPPMAITSVSVPVASTKYASSSSPRVDPQASTFTHSCLTFSRRVPLPSGPANIGWSPAMPESTTAMPTPVPSSSVPYWVAKSVSACCTRVVCVDVVPRSACGRLPCR